MQMLFTPSKENFEQAQTFIKLIDKTGAPVPKQTSPILSRLTKQIKKVNEPVPRYFESPNQVQSYWAEGEFDLIAVFKLLDTESYFFKASQKKLSQLIKSGFEVHSDDDEIKEYFKNRFLMMFLQTGLSFDKIVKQLGHYLIVCSNAFLIKVRDKNCQFATSYTIDGKKMEPIVGLFMPHPTQMKPRFKWVQYNANGKKQSKMILDKWVHVNRRGQIVEFEPDDVAHFTLHKQDGMIFGTPEIIPVIDDIRTYRKMEEDSELLAYRDLFPILHYTIEDPVPVDHATGQTEIDIAKHQLERLPQDGGIATDSRHKIEFIGSKGQHLDLMPYIDHFKARVFTGLGVSSADMGEGQDISGNTANSMSKSLLDAVRFIQQEISAQFEEKILYEMALQSPFGVDALKTESRVQLSFTEIDIEWKIRKENHEADLFAKGVKTIDEVRNPMGHDTFTDEHLNRTYHGLYEKPMQEQELALAHKQVGVQAATKISQIKKKAQTARSKDPMKRSAADRDAIKAAKSNSNIVKSTRDYLTDSLNIQDEFKAVVADYLDKDKTSKKLGLVIATKCFYDRIKSDMVDRVKDGMSDAAADMGIEFNPNKTKIEHNIFQPLDALRDSVVTMIDKDSNSVNRASLRVAQAHKTEQTRAYNYGYALMAMNNDKCDFTVYSDAEDVAADSAEHIGEEITVNKTDVLTKIPPFRTNSRLKIKVR